MLRRLGAVALFSVVVPALVARQNSSSVGRWRNFTDMKSVAAIDVRADAAWAATTGGAFAYMFPSSGFQKYTNSEGLSSNELSAVSIDQAGRIWLGSTDGSISLYENGWRLIMDIALSNRLQKSIRKFVQRGDSMFVASDFGVSVYVISKQEFADTYSNFGVSSPVVSSVLIHAGRIWVATNQGAAMATLGSLNLTSPTAWTIYGAAKGLPSPSATCLGVFSDTLVIGTNNGAAFFLADSFRAMNSTASRSIADIEQRGSQLYILSNGSNSFLVESLTMVNGPAQAVASSSNLTSKDLSVPSGSSAVWVATSTSGIAQWNGSAWNYFFPNGPQSSQFLNVGVDKESVLWAASGINGSGKGFYRFDPRKPDGSQWKNFTNVLYPVLQFDDYYKVSVSGNSVWVSSWGRGVVEVVGDSVRRRIHANSVPSLASTVPSDPNFIVVGSVTPDGTGSPWFVNRTAANGNFLAQLVNDTTFAYHRNQWNPSDGLFTNLAIDRESTKWLANSEPSVKNPGGLYYFNENRVVSGTDATAGWGFMSTSEGLPNATVMSLAVDHDGDVWIGTDLGVLIITDPLFPRTRRTSSFPLREQSIQTIAVDGVNNKWIGTKEGVFVVNSDGTQLLQQFNSISTGGQLVSNDVRSIAIDQQRGIVYFGTEKGLSSLQIEAVSPRQTYSTLEVGPNPFILPNSDQLMIRNLVANSTVKILTITGKLISQFKAQGGGRAFWDGKDSQGKLVSSGVYVIVAFAENGNQVITGKVAIVRR